MISIKKVTKQTGITVRTLRYYDQIDLLKPAGKSEGGHRLYGEAELKKLQQIQFLKRLGLSLQEIKNILTQHNWNWFNSIQEQLNYVQKEKEKLIEIESILTGILHAKMMDADIQLTNIQQLIQLYEDNRAEQRSFRKKLFTNEEVEMLALLPNVNHSDPDTLEWIALIGQLKQNMSKGHEADEVQRIIQRIAEKSMETVGDNEQFLEKLWEIRTSPEKSEQAGLYPIEPELLAFFEAAWIHYEQQEQVNF
ncbi:MerR family transcriptional regulator [Virgibacillus soli]|uniref:MerR family transcriptional regulator n=1 Tax=Paracerasibacillus soli TaxID=480284 RepID=A0ABU5CVV2_9BACI|nr:MerR family transcriptional regulator [Virgibacillus soli]MDY0410505.1 MerR family transcriptional regulator [Virgibacillus soli]